MPKYFKAGRDLKLKQLTSPESCLANDIGRMTWYHNTYRLAIAHSLGMMPDYMRGRICFNKITGLVKVKWLSASDQRTREKIKDTNTEWDVCLAMPTPRQLRLPAGLNRVDPSTLFGGSFGRISNKINVWRFFTLWTAEEDGYDPLVYFHNQTGSIEFEGLDFNLQSPSREFGSIRNPNFIKDKLDQRERELWDEFREWRAKYKNSAFITDVWEPLENMRGGKFGVLNKKYIPGIVSTAIKRHYKLITPQIAQFLLERHEGIKVTLDAENFCPFQYFDEAKEDPYLHSAAGGGMKECSTSEGEMPYWG